MSEAEIVTKALNRLAAAWEVQNLIAYQTLRNADQNYYAHDDNLDTTIRIKLGY